MKPFFKATRYTLHAFLITLTVIVITSTLYLSGSFNQIERQVEDFKAQLSREGSEASQKVLVVMVDEASISALDPLVGGWPWPRSIWADVVEYLTLGGASNIVFDILFTERHLEDGQSNAHDLAFAQLTKASGRVTHAMQLLKDSTNPNPNQQLPLIVEEKFSLNNAFGIPNSDNNTFYVPYNELYHAAHQLAVVEFKPDNDGRYRRTHLFRSYQNQIFPVLSIAPVLNQLNIQEIHQHPNQLHLDQLKIPLESDQSYRVNFYEHIESISVASIIASIAELRKGNVESLYTDPRLTPPDLFQDKIVFIGASAVGLEDLKSTPIHSRWPGVYLHASITSNILLQDFIYQAPRYWTLFSIIVFALLTFLLVTHTHSIKLQFAYPLGLAIGYGLFNLTIFEYQYYLIDLTPAITAIFASWLMLSAYRASTEGREKSRVRAMLAQYVSPAALNSALNNYQEQLQAEVGKEELMSIVFSDIRQFTNLCEGMTPQQIVEMLNIHLDAMTQVTFKHSGTMDKFIGDATMAFWGAPIADKEHATHATLAAMEMQTELKSVNQKIKQLGFEPIRMGVGVNSGKVILGNIGASQKLDYTVIGDAVNLASRIESLTKVYGLDVLISEFTYQQVKQNIICGLVDEVAIKGKKQPVKIYTPLAVKDCANAELAVTQANHLKSAFNAYHTKNYNQAISFYSKLPDQPFKILKKLFLSRIQDKA